MVANILHNVNKFISKHVAKNNEQTTDGQVTRVATFVQFAKRLNDNFSVLNVPRLNENGGGT